MLISCRVVTIPALREPKSSLSFDELGKPGGVQVLYWPTMWRFVIYSAVNVNKQNIVYEGKLGLKSI
jgi:hypothetical protein